MTSERRLVEATLDDILGMCRWRVLGRRARIGRLYFQLRAEGATWKRARGIVRRVRKAEPGLRREPAGRAVAVSLILS